MGRERGRGSLLQRGEGWGSDVVRREGRRRRGTGNRGMAVGSHGNSGV